MDRKGTLLDSAAFLHKKEMEFPYFPDNTTFISRLGEEEKERAEECIGEDAVGVEYGIYDADHNPLYLCADYRSAFTFLDPEDVLLWIH